MSKGSKRRPSQLSQAEMDKRWQMAFGNKPKGSTDERKSGQPGDRAESKLQER